MKKYVSSSNSAWLRLRKDPPLSNFWNQHSSMKLMMIKTIMKLKYSRATLLLKNSLLRTFDRPLIVQFPNRKMKMKVKSIRLCKEKLDILKQHLRITKVSLSNIRLKKSPKIFKRVIMMKNYKGTIMLPQICIVRMTKRK